MMVSRATYHAALTTVAALLLCATAMAQGPVFESPVDGAMVQGKVLIKAEKRHLDGAQALERYGGDYIAYRVAAGGEREAKGRFVGAVIHPYELVWDTQEIHINPNDPWDPFNGSRKYPDGRYTLTASAFSARGEALGAPTEITVFVRNNVPDPPLDANGRVLLRPGGVREQEMRYVAEGELYARLTEEEKEESEDVLQPPFVEMKLGAEWRNVYRKPFGPGHTDDGRRFHSEGGLAAAALPWDPQQGGRVRDWRSVAYAICDTYPEHGWVEMVGLSLSQLEDWREREAGLAVLDPTADVLQVGGAPGAAMGMGLGEAAAGAGAMPGAEAMGAGGMPGGPTAGLMGGAGMPGGAMAGMGMGMGAGEMAGVGMGEAGVGAAATGAVSAAGGVRALDRVGSFMPVNLPGLHRKFRSVVYPDAVVGKVRHHDPRWPLGELWTPLPAGPVAAGETWSGAITILPFFDQQYHIRVHNLGGSVHGPTHEDPLLHHTRRLITPPVGGPQIVEVRPGGANGPIVHVLDGFEYYKGYECARIVTRFRNYVDRDSWSLERMVGWRLADLNPRMIGAGTIQPSSMVQVDLTRVTYYAYRSGHVVGMEDYYHNKLWIGEAGFGSLVGVVGRTRGVRESFATVNWPVAEIPGRQVWPRDTRRGLLGAPAAAPTGVGAGMPGAEGEMGGPGGMGGMEAGMGMPGAGMPGAGMPGMGMPGAGMPGADMPGAVGAPGALGDDAVMCDVVANVTIKISEMGGSDVTHPRVVPDYAALPPVGGTGARPPGPRQTEAQVHKRFVVVEETGLFYLPGSPALVGQRGVVLETTAEQLIRLGFTPAPDVKLD